MVTGYNDCDVLRSVYYEEAEHNNIKIQVKDLDNTRDGGN